ncbi:phage tail protein [Salmonella enterica]|nr:phage tail protein [Salmonella enterica]EMD3787930.1 phage tail protein [Salmonella enterica]EMD4773248.1 phage tail protein [Salmonella enterica]EMD6063066.1 phage tail protein [Salmonella enterica]
MTQTVITSAFNRLRAQEAAGGRRIILDRFIFANIPGLDTTIAPSPDTQIPEDSLIVHHQATDMAGMVNEDTVTWSVTLPSGVGDFSFNWIGLINSESGTLAMVSVMETQHKVRTANGIQGNVLTYSETMKFDNAAAQMAITTPVSTWQVDVSARLHGMDETTRRMALDIYGPAVFMDDAFRLTAQGVGQATIAPGLAYIRGLRLYLDTPATLTFSAGMAQTISLDAVQTGSANGEQSVTFTLINQDTADYTDALGRRHYVTPLARVSTDGTLTDLRTVFRPVSQQLNGDFLRRDKNLHDLPDAQEARRAMGLGDSATLSVGTTQGTVAAGNDRRITGAMQKDQNGADIPDKPLFVKNIGLNETLNPTKRVSIGSIGNGVFDGSTPCINIGDSDSGFIGSADGVIDIYCNNARVGYIDNSGLHILEDIFATGSLHAGNATYATDGNIYGSVWGGWLRDWLNSNKADKNTASLATNGWFKDASTGLIIQWGIAAGNLNRSVVNLPIPFPNSGLWALGWVSGTLDLGDDDWSNSASMLNNSQLTVTTDHGWNTAWIAIGH